MVVKEQSKKYITSCGDQYWCLPSKGKWYWHRENGPAYISIHGTKCWYFNDVPHRLDGPAYEWANGDKDWFIYGRSLAPRKTERWLKENNIDLKTPEGQMAFKLRWS